MKVPFSHYVQQQYLENGLSTHHHFSMKLMLITSQRSTTTQNLYRFKFTLVNKSHSQHRPSGNKIKLETKLNWPSRVRLRAKARSSWGGLRPSRKIFQIWCSEIASEVIFVPFFSLFCSSCQVGYEERMMTSFTSLCALAGYWFNLGMSTSLRASNVWSGSNIACISALTRN